MKRLPSTIYLVGIAVLLLAVSYVDETWDQININIQIFMFSE